MKKLILALLLLTSVKTFAQTTPSQQSFGQKILSRLEFGIKGGVNVSNFQNFNASTDPLIGFHGGLSVAYRFTDHLMVQEDFLFSTQGAKLKAGVLGSQDLKLSYVTVPIVLKYRTTSGFYVEAGGQAGIKVKEQVAGFSSTNFAKKIDAAAVGGLGYQSRIGLGIGARYIYGISKVGDFNNLLVNNDFKNSTIQASLFYTF
ncbi:hypothetical protein CKK33_01960 [Mucilaginibacter sp. MD40]|uniref:porin family protein n=1 Tax=Mucilaginibacter sp. MD40 TaxID=2029590 RepID=UPI000BACD515|nr:porin family protein [Mucilaginibacter sp. MD40]PAW92322.1 hypothetical protein CKK33_01960 [Mucilaginibacter sp. MD40]